MDGPTDPGTGLNGRVLDFLDSLDCLIDYCIDNDADLVLFAGDAFHKSSPNTVILNEYTKRIYRLSKQCPIVLLVGNHDAPYSNTEKVSSIEVYNSLKIPNIVIGNKYEVISIETKSGIIQIATFPYPSRQIFKTAKDISNKIKSLEKCITQSSPAIFLGHFGIKGAKVGSESEYIISDEAQLEVSWLTRGPWDYVALGHIHNYQCLNEGEIPPVVYPGSLDRVNFGEENQDKGFIWLEITKETIDYYFVSVNPRPMITLDYEFDNASRHITRKIVEDIESRDLRDSIVRVRIKIPDRLSNMLRTVEIYEALRGCYFIHSLSISRTRELEETRLGDLGVPLSSLPSLELLDKYFTSIVPVVGDGKRKLLKLATEIMEESNE